jgi:Protein of unknown function (DUF1616)
MNLADIKLIYVFSCIMLGLIILSPTLFAIVSFPRDEQFSELYILGSDHMLDDIPSNIAENSLHTVYISVGNHMGYLESYLVYVKLRNQTEPLPDSIMGNPSSLTPVFEYRTILSDNEVWEKEVPFSFDDISFNGNESRVTGFSINGHFVNVDKVSVWDEEKNMFFYQLFFELWIYNSKTSAFEFHNRSVGFMLNLTKPLQ